MAFQPENRDPFSFAPDKPTGIRVQKFLAEQGVASRRKSEDLIREGRVRINGRIAELGDRIDPQNDRVHVGSRSIQAVRKPQIVLVLNKPKGAVCTNQDERGAPTVFDLLPTYLRKERLFTAGRLDKDSEGLVVLTNDGDFAQQMTHPGGSVLKRYHVRVHRPFNPQDVPGLLEGRELEGELLRVDKVIPAKQGPDAERRLEIHLGHGRKREIRRILEAFGYFVKSLRRVQIGRYPLRGLGPGQYRKLGPREIKMLLQTRESRNVSP